MSNDRIDPPRFRSLQSESSSRLRPWQNILTRLGMITFVTGLIMSVLLLYAGCYITFVRTPFDFPRYPAKAEFTAAIEGYQNTIAENHYNMWSNYLVERYAFQHLRIHEHYLYAAQCGLTIFDITQPKQIVVVGNYQDSCGVDDLIIADGRAYLAARDKGVTVLDVSNPTTPKLLGSYEHNAGPDAPPFSLAVIGNFIYLHTTAPKLPLDDTPYAEREKKKFEGFYPEQLRWQVIKMEDNGENLRLTNVQSVDDLGRPMAQLDNYIYAATRWRQNVRTDNTYLQTLEVQEDGTLKVVNEQVIQAIIDNIKIYDNRLFGSLGSRIRTWDISTPQHPVEISTTYNARGEIGDFATIDVDRSRILGEGYSLEYQREPDSVQFQLFARVETPEQITNCRVWIKPEAECQLQLLGKTRRGVDAGRGSVLYGDYLFYPYNIATEGSEEGFVLVDFAILVYKFP